MVVIALLHAQGQAKVAFPMQTEPSKQPVLGTRILIWGSSCSGKSTLAERLAEQLGIACIDMNNVITHGVTHS